ncbi:NaeI family type II restriction endonuclease [Nocardiopsis suaedae]|uniref:NaeI family type II restriction endonuclease n=1 Tax=Nocardiopsis suaedae TaxID=3018444 RepID=A0ABT4TRV7_9ACTN|nr:NaeI family type II restriction endonuclease [Nocardiopsis suaedae]MDA2807404.1 NaeI family type II restriction endonuclease [Nocardiopsis suaedae]
MMGNSSRQRGRPWSDTGTLDPDTAALANFLRKLISDSMSLRTFSEKLTAEHYEANPPSYSTLSARLAGKGLARDGRLVHAVVTLCAPTGKTEILREEAQRLLRNARNTNASPNPTRRNDDQNESDSGLRNEIVELKNTLTSIQKSQTNTQDMLLAIIRDLTQLRDAPHAPTQDRKLDTAAPVSGEPQEYPDLLLPPPQNQINTRQHDRDEKLLEHIKHDILRSDPHGYRGSRAIRESIDRVLYGSRTGRFDIFELTKSERTYLVSLIKMELTRYLSTNPPEAENARTRSEANYAQVNGIDIDVVFSWRMNWTISNEQVGKPLLLATANEKKSVWSLGIARASPENLRSAANRDGKRSLAPSGMKLITWIFRDSPLPPNTLLSLPEETINKILSYSTAQKRVDALFRIVRQRPISLTAAKTVSMQEDAGKRIRNSRRILAEEGLTILSGRDQQDVDTAQSLGLQKIHPEEYMTINLISP